MNKRRLIDLLTNLYVTGGPVTYPAISPVYEPLDSADQFSRILQEEFADITKPVYQPQTLNMRLYTTSTQVGKL